VCSIDSVLFSSLGSSRGYKPGGGGRHSSHLVNFISQGSQALIAKSSVFIVVTVVWPLFGFIQFLEWELGLSVLNAEYKRNYDIKTGINSFGQDGGKGSDLPFYQKLKQKDTRQTNHRKKKKENE